MAHSRIGIWLIGSKGGVATTATLGLLAIQKKLIGTAGLVSQFPQFENLPLPRWDDFVIAGHEIRRVPLANEAAAAGH